VAMDKLLSKVVARQAGVPVPAFSVLGKADFLSKQAHTFNHYLQELDAAPATGRLVVKPVDAGSSVGVHIISGPEELDTALSDAFQYSHQVLVEEYIEGRELTVTVLDGVALPVVEIRPHQGFYDYPNKYSAGNTDYHAPADLTQEETAQIQDYALRIWQAMECSGYGRIDFRYNRKEFCFLEVNTLPGMTPLSLTPMAAKAVDISFGELLDRIIQAVQPDNT
jgi:D-alanine-D-alanine ligase